MRALALLLLLAGCQKYDSTQDTKGVFYPDSRIFVYALEDGTRCAVHVNGGLHCDWRCRP